MISKNIFVFLFFITGVVSLWIGSAFFYDLHRYFQLSVSAPAILDNWSIQEDEKGVFSIAVNYQFEWKQKPIQGVYHFEKPIYKNPYLARDYIDEWKDKDKDFKIWLSPNQPTLVSMQRNFPVKKGMHLILCLAIFLYFFFLKSYVKKINTLDQRFS